MNNSNNIAQQQAAALAQAAQQAATAQAQNALRPPMTYDEAKSLAEGILALAPDGPIALMLRAFMRAREAWKTSSDEYERQRNEAVTRCTALAEEADALRAELRAPREKKTVTAPVADSDSAGEPLASHVETRCMTRITQVESKLDAGKWPRLDKLAERLEHLEDWAELYSKSGAVAKFTR